MTYPHPIAQVEDRPVIMERVTYVKEHRPVEKEYVVSLLVPPPSQAFHAVLLLVTVPFAFLVRNAKALIAVPPWQLSHARGRLFLTPPHHRPLLPCLACPCPTCCPWQVETRATGVEREAAEGRVQESLGTQSRVVEEAKPRAPCE